MLLSSLSVYRGITGRSVIKAYINLLSAMDREPEIFLNSYGEFFSLLSGRGAADRLLYCMTEAALFDENIFTLAATADDIDTLSQNVLQAAESDLNSVIYAGSLSSQDIFDEYKFSGEIQQILSALPRWSTGTAALPFKDAGVDLSAVARFHRENGCGMFARYKAFVWREGRICPVEHPDRISIDSFVGYERQRNMVVNNTLAFLQGKSANNCLLYGDMGTGKSSTVKAIANEYRSKGLRVVEMPKERLMDFPVLADKIAPLPMKFIIFIDDLSFQSQDQSYTSLKAVLEGGLAARPANTLIYATSNRRHLVKESWSDRNCDDVNRRDNMQETLSLSDRFGLAVCFGNPDRKEYLEIVYSLADKSGVEYDKEELARRAEIFALGRGGRSPRCAKQFIESLSF